MKFIWPDGIRCAAILSFDLDGEAGIVQANPQNAENLCLLSWARYGTKVGLPRILDLLRAKQVRASFFVSCHSAQLYPQLVKCISSEGHEIGVHGYLNRDLSASELEQQEAALVSTIEMVEKLTGRKVLGYRAPSCSMNLDTPALIARHQLLYDSSLMDDDRPYILPTAAGNLAEIPLSWTNNDWQHFGTQVEQSNGCGAITKTCQQVLQLWQEEFAGIYHYGGVFVLRLHPEIIGRPAQLLLLEKLIDYMRMHSGVWFTTGEQIARLVLGQGKVEVKIKSTPHRQIKCPLLTQDLSPEQISDYVLKLLQKSNRRKLNSETLE